MHLLRSIAITIILLSFVSSAYPQIGPPLAGDYNVDGIVNSGDYSVWRSTFGEVGFGAFADGNFDGMVDTLDYFVWKLGFGLTVDSVRFGIGGPSVTIDLIRDSNSRPVLDASGNWQFSFAIVPDSTAFSDTFDIPDKGVGSALTIDLGLQINDEHGIANTTVSSSSVNTSSQSFENDPNWDGNAVDSLGADNPGTSPYGVLADGQGLDAVGHQIDAFLGTVFLNTDQAGAGHELFTFSAGRPAMDSNFGGLTIEVDIDGGYGSGFYRLTQDFVTFDAPDADDFFTYTVQAGDVNLDGTVDTTDLSILDSSLNTPGVWTDGDLTGEGVVDSSDRNLLLAILVPEPTSLLLSVFLIGATMLHRPSARTTQR